MPRHPKPANLRQNRERVDVGLVGPRVVEGPPAPRSLLAATKVAWVAFWKSPLARLVHPDSDLTALARLFGLYDERERAYRVVRRHRMVGGSKGQPRANPLYGILSMLDTEIRQLEDRFGMSPRSRLVLGVKFSDEPSLDDLNAELEQDDDDEPDDDEPEIDPRRLIALDGGAG